VTPIGKVFQDAAIAQLAIRIGAGVGVPQLRGPDRDVIEKAAMAAQ